MRDIRAAPLTRLGARIDHLYHALVRNRFAAVTKNLATHTSPGAVVLDIGANHGRFAKHLAHIHNNNVTLHAFEPLEYNRHILDIAIRGKPNVTVHPIALSNTVGQTEIYVPYKKASSRFLHGSAHLGSTEHTDHFGTNTAPDVCRTTITTTTLDRWADEHALNRLDLIKMDVEGAEPLVIEGALNALSRFHPVLYFELIPGLPERLGRTVHDATAPLLDLGYTLHVGDRDMKRTRPVDQYTEGYRDYLALPPEPRPMTR